jgi:hypothetical protein
MTSVAFFMLSEKEIRLIVMILGLLLLGSIIRQLRSGAWLETLPPATPTHATPERSPPKLPRLIDSQE